MSKLAILGGTPIGAGQKATWPIWGDLEKQKVSEMIESGMWGTLGPRQVEFEEAWAKYNGVPYGVMMTNGTHTLRLALEALGIGPGDEVIVPGLTWQATAASALDVNAIPVLCDIDPETYTIDPRQIEKLITPNTKAIIPVHLYGRTADMDAIMAIAKAHNLYVIEDCAHQHGSEWRGQKVGTIGVIGSFSLQASKILTTGEGGICLTKDNDLYEKMYSLKFCGREHTPGGPTMQSGNYRSNEFAAAIGLAQLTRFDAQNKIRHEHALYLEEKLGQNPGLRMFKRDERVTFQTYYQFPMHFITEAWDGATRKQVWDAVKAELENAIDLRGTYDPLNMSPLYQPLSKKTHKLNAEYSKRIDPRQYTLPVCERAFKEDYIGFSQQQLLVDVPTLDKIIDAFAKVYENRKELASSAK